MLKKITKISLVCLFLASLTGRSQINDGGSKPYSFKFNNTSLADIDAVSTPSQDWAAIAAQDDATQEKDATFYRTGHLIQVGIDLQNHGTWETLANGDKIWRVHITSDDALAINLYFDQFNIPDGARMHVYSPDHEQVLGGYTSFNNSATGLFATELIDGDELIVEYYEPVLVAGQGNIVIGQVGHTYRTGSFGSSDPCQVNVNCAPEGSGKEQQRDAVARVLVTVNAGQGWCSGSMVNNTNQDCTPYFLTAMHCGLDGSNLTTAANINQWVFYFNYQSTGCSNMSKPAPNTITGATTVAHSGDGGGNSGSDFLLLELNNSPQQSWNVFYAGWNRNNTASLNGYGIHHPSGDIKKISTYTSTLVSTQWGSAAGSHWRVVWSGTTNGHGVTEGGSSGSPIFNSNGEIVGTLTGGSSFCTATSSPDLYGKMSYHWTSNGAASNRQLEPWLDPAGTGATTLAGVYYPCAVASNPDDAGISAINSPVDGQTTCDNPFTPEVVITNYGTNTLTSATINYQVDNGPISTFNWTGSLTSLGTATVTLNPISAPTPGVPFDFTAYTTNPNGQTDPDNTNDTTVITSQIQLSSAIPYAEDFAGGAMPTDIFIFDQTGDAVTWEHNAGLNAYGAGAGAGVIEMDNFNTNTQGTFDWVILPSFDLSASTNTEMTFDVAYARYDGTYTDSLVIAIDDNCDGTYDVIYFEGGSDLATAPDVTTAFIPTNTQWKNETVNLSAYDGLPHVSVAFINVGGWGQFMYLDNINLQGVVGCNLTASVSAQTDVDCNGNTNGSATIAVTGGSAPISYNWSNGGTNATESGLAAGTYTVIVTDNNACADTVTVVITEPAALMASNSNVTHVLCNGDATGSFDVNASGGTAPYSYDAGSGSQSSSSFTGLTAGVYNVTVTDANGCTAVTVVTINQPASALASSSSSVDASCGASDGSATVTATGGTAPYTYLWSNGQTTATATGLAAGGYTCTITDANGCTSVETIAVSNAGAPTATISASTDATCAGAADGSATVSATGGSSPYTYLWSDGQTTATATGLSAGTYSVTVTDASGCSSVVNVTINEPAALSITVDGTSNPTGSSATDGSISTTVTGGTAPYTYSWDNGATTDDITGLGTGVYVLTVTDANGCTTTETVTLTYVGIGDELNDIEALIVPNPSDGNFTLQVTLNDYANIDVYVHDAVGRLVFRHNVSIKEGNLPINISNEANGMYVVTIRNASTSKTMRVQKLN